MADPKLRTASVTIAYSADDGYRAKSGFNMLHDGKPDGPLLDALEELARLTELFGSGDEAEARFNAARQRVREWRERNAARSGDVQ